MEVRIAKLESDMAQASRDIGDVKGKLTSIDDRLRRVEVSIVRLDERVAHLPSKGFIVSALVISLTIFGGALGLALNIQKLLGH